RAHSGDVWAGRNAADRGWAGARVAAPAGPELPSAADHQRPAQFLGQHLRSGPQGPPPPLSEARMARGSVECATREAAGPAFLITDRPADTYQSLACAG